MGYSLYLVLLRPPVCLMSLRIVISLFLRLLMGSFLSTLYVLVSCSRIISLVSVVLLIHDDHGQVPPWMCPALDV